MTRAGNDETALADSSVAGSGPTTYAVRAVERTFDILGLFVNSPVGLAAAEIASALSMPRSSAFRYLAVLEKRQYLSKFDGVRYRLGPAFLSFEEPFLDTLAVTSRPVLEQLRDRHRETFNLGMLVGSRVLYVDVVESYRAVRFSARRGDREFVHSSALGKAIAAQLSEGELERILRVEGLPTLTPHTISEPLEFRRVLKTVRQLGFATDRSESEEGACCVGVAIDTGTAPFKGALSFSTPAERFTDAALPGIVADLQSGAAAIADLITRTSDHATVQPLF
jgi:IclR family transcriptional regulator, acetate operon repressor